MALVNDAKKEINAKIVYIGPRGAGKNTALRSIYSRLRPEYRSDLKCLASGEHQMLFFDFSYPLPARTDDYVIRFHVYTILAGEGTPPPWKMLLKGVDGVVFLADSADGRMFGNLESCTQLFDAFAHYGVKGHDVPLSLQCNKRDLPDALPLAAIKKELFPEMRGEALPVTALTGDGLLEGLNRMIREIMLNLGQDGAAQEVEDKLVGEPARKGEDYGIDLYGAAQHCTDDNSGFTVESAGAPEVVAGNTIIIPLRLKGGECGKSVDFKVTVSVSI